MNWYRMSAYLHYRRKAKTRHGIHSPFVFAFIEQGLRTGGRATLPEKIGTYFQGRERIEAIPNAPESWPGLLAEHAADKNRIIIIPGIHDTPAQAQAWQQLHRHPSVTLSIDLFRCGLLFFQEEFLVKQHFVLKYPA